MDAAGPRASVYYMRAEKASAQGILQPALGWSGAIVLLPSDIASRDSRRRCHASRSAVYMGVCCFAKAEKRQRGKKIDRESPLCSAGLMILLFCGDCCKCVIPHLFGVYQLTIYLHCWLLLRGDTNLWRIYVLFRLGIKALSPLAIIPRIDCPRPLV